MAASRSALWCCERRVSLCVEGAPDRSGWAGSGGEPRSHLGWVPLLGAAARIDLILFFLGAGGEELTSDPESYRLPIGGRRSPPDRWKWFGAAPLLSVLVGPDSLPDGHKWPPLPSLFHVHSTSANEARLLVFFLVSMSWFRLRFHHAALFQFESFASLFQRLRSVLLPVISASLISCYVYL